MKPQNRSISKQLSITMWHIATFALFPFCITTGTPAQTAAQIAKTKAATVSLEMKDNTGKIISIGSGFFVRSNLIATNYHIIEGTASGTAKVDDKDTSYNIEGFTAIDKVNDLVLLKVTAHGIKPLPLGNSDTLGIGETVHVADNSLGYLIFWDGIIKRFRDKYTKERILMTASTAPGRSGAPVLNREGEVIGMSYITIEDGQNLNFAIPARSLKALLAESERVHPLPSDTHSISAKTYFLRGKMMESLWRYADAVEAYTQAIRRNPNYKAYYNQGSAKNWLGQYAAAIQDYDKAIQLSPDDFLLYLDRGDARAKFGQHFAAIQDYDKVIQLSPQGARAYHSRGNVKAKLGQYFASIQDYDKAIQVNPNYAVAYYSRGKTKARLGQYFEAIQDYDKAIHLMPDDFLVYRSRGIAKAQLEQYAAAIQDYDKAIQLKPDFANAYYSRGLSKGLLNRKWEAKQDFQTALKLAKQIGDVSLESDIKTLLQTLK